MKYLLKVLITPMCWMQNYRYSETWNTTLNKLLTTNNFEYQDSAHAKIGKYIVWIENHPYASFHPTNNISVRPSRRTILKAYDKLLADIFNRNTETTMPL